MRAVLVLLASLLLLAPRQAAGQEVDGVHAESAALRRKLLTAWTIDLFGRNLPAVASMATKRRQGTGL